MKLKKYWHDFYYKLSGESGKRLALSCREAMVEEERFKNSKNLSDRLRYYLHLSLCRACSRYTKYSIELKNYLKSQADTMTVSEMQKINEKTFEKFKK